MLFAVAARIVPAVATMDAGARPQFQRIIADALATRPPALQRQFWLLLTVIRVLALLRFGALFERLPGPRQDIVLRWLLDCPVTKLRGGFWGLRTLIFMGYYARPEAWGEIQYAPMSAGGERFGA
jgi:hypothetical protein